MQNTAKKITLAIIILFSATTLTGCAGNYRPGYGGQDGALLGGIIGAVAGQAIGHNTESTLIGVAVGTMLGYIVGNEMDKYDLQELNHVYERGVSNRPSSWVNPDTGKRYTVIPQPAYAGSNNQVCRKAEITAIIDGKTEKTYTTACRDAYGNWILQ